MLTCKLQFNTQELTATNEELVAAQHEQVKNEEELKMTNQELNVFREQLTILNQDLENRVLKRTKEVDKLLLQKDDFIHQLGHDLKTPLSPMLGILPIIKDEIKDTKTKEALEVVLKTEVPECF